MLGHEKILIQKNYYPVTNSSNLLSFYHKDDPDRQVNVSVVDNKYKVSFALSDNAVHYATYFDTQLQANEYLDYILKTHI